MTQSGDDRWNRQNRHIWREGERDEGREGGRGREGAPQMRHVLKPTVAHHRYGRQLNMYRQHPLWLCP